MRGEKLYLENYMIYLFIYYYALNIFLMNKKGSANAELGSGRGSSVQMTQ